MRLFLNENGLVVTNEGDSSKIAKTHLRSSSEPLALFQPNLAQSILGEGDFVQM